MKNQHIILIGISIWFCGVILDNMLIRYAYLLIHVGTLITIYGCIMWVRVSENRKQIRKYFFARGNFMEKITQIFDFSWSRVSIICTFCALGGILIVHLMGLGMGSTGAYKEAIKSLKADESIHNQVGEILDFSYMITGNTTTRGRSNLNIGIIGDKENIKVIVVVDGADGVYKTKKIIIKNKKNE